MNNPDGNPILVPTKAQEATDAANTGSLGVYENEFARAKRMSDTRNREMDRMIRLVPGHVLARLCKDYGKIGDAVTWRDLNEEGYIYLTRCIDRAVEDIDDPIERKLYLDERKMRTVEKFCPDECCPACRNKVMVVDQWILTQVKRPIRSSDKSEYTKAPTIPGGAICKSCFSVMGHKKPTLVIDFVIGQTYQYELKKFGLKRMRTGISKSSILTRTQTQISDMLGECQSSYYRIENINRQITKEKFDRLIPIFEEMGYTKEEIMYYAVKSTIVRNKINGKQLRLNRMWAGIGLKAFATNMPWDVTRQVELESGDVKTLTIEVTNKIIKMLKRPW
jgi:hypothetical protein